MDGDVSMSSSQRFLLALAFLAVLYTGLTIDLGLHSPVQWELEEMHNATAAREVAVGNFALLPFFQATDFCGGCTVVSAVGGLFFSITGPTWASWKAVPLVFGLATLLLGALVGRSVAGPRAGLLFATLYAMSPPVLGQAALYSRGNHFEVVPLLFACVLAALAAQRKGTRWQWILLGGLTSLTGWFCLTGLPPALALLFVTCLCIGRARLLPALPPLSLGLALGTLPAGWFVLRTGRDPLRFFLESNVSTEFQIEHMVTRLGLASWALMGDYLSLLDTPKWGALGHLWSVLMMVGLAAWLVRLRRGQLAAGDWFVLALWAAAVLSYVVAPVQRSIAGPYEGIPDNHAVRYLTVPWTLGLVVVALGLDRLRQRWGGAVLLPILVLGLLAAVIPRWQVHLSETPDGERRQVALPFDYTLWACQPGSEVRWPQAGFCYVPPEVLRDWTSPDLTSRVNAGRLLGCYQAPEFRSTSLAELPSWLDALVEEKNSSWVLHGLGRCLGLQLTSPHHEDTGSSLDVLARLAVASRHLDRRLAEVLATGVWTAPGSWPDVDEITEENAALWPKTWSAYSAHPGETEDLTSLFELGPNSIPESGVARRAALLGLGFSHGQASPNLPGPLPSLSVQDRALFERGMLLGAAPRWRSSVTEDTPVELVP